MLNLIIVCLFGVALGKPSCFVQGKCTSSTVVGGDITKNERDCLCLCKNTLDCMWFTFIPDGNYCALFQDCEILSQESCKDCVSGELVCDILDNKCFVRGKCNGVVLDFASSIDKSSECLALCQKTEKCAWFTHIASASTCILLESCQELDESCSVINGCVSGESVCKAESDESLWHLTIGGKDGSAALNSAELYNWQTGAQCFIEPLPQAMEGLSGTLIDGDPVVCGGDNGTAYDVKCFHYERSTKKWKRLGDLLAAVYLASDVYIIGQGWFLFGGYNNYLETSQKLVGIDSKWEQGPPVISQRITGQCAVKVSENVTAFIGGDRYPRDIYLYDWSSEQPTFVLQDEKLIKKRYTCSCTLFESKDGSSVVAIVGGEETGMELWNPITKEVQLLWNEIPPEAGSSYGLRYAEILPVNDASELILYGGYAGSNTDEIWKYNVERNSWTKIGNLQSKRAAHVTLSVKGLKC